MAPDRCRQLKFSNDPNFVSKLHDIVGLYVDLSGLAIILPFDEQSQTQALDRTQLGLPMKMGRLGTMIDDYKRYGTTTLFAALKAHDGTVTDRNAASPPSGVHPLLYTDQSVDPHRLCCPCDPRQLYHP